jgi:hypothetical protein
MSIEALRSALAAEHAAIFGYGVVGAYVSGAARDSARQAETAHRDRRDQVALRIEAAGGAIVGAQGSYALPFPVNDASSAVRLAAQLEEGTAGAWREALSGTTGEDRALALDALIACAVQATRWRKAAGISPTTVTFPGGATA